MRLPSYQESARGAQRLEQTYGIANIAYAVDGVFCIFEYLRYVQEGFMKQPM